MELPTNDPVLSEIFELLHRLTGCHTVGPVRSMAMQIKRLVIQYIDEKAHIKEVQ